MYLSGKLGYMLDHLHLGRFLWAIYFALLLPWTRLPLVSQPATYRTYTMHDGLSQMKITDLHLDTRGYLWIGTRNGLNKFDGENFSIYTSQDGLSHDRIHKIDEDPDGNLVVLTYKGVDLFDGKRFRSFPLDFRNVLYDMAVTGEQEIWICDKEKERKLWLLKNGEYRTVYSQPELSGFLSLVAFGDAQRALFSSGDSLFIAQGDSLVFSQVIDPAASLFRGLKGQIYLFQQTASQIIFSEMLSGAVRKILIIDKSDLNKITQFPLHSFDAHFMNNGSFFLPDNQGERMKLIPGLADVRAVVRDVQGQYWIAGDNGLVLLNNSPFQSYSPDELPNIWTVVEDKKNNLWFGSFGDGLFMQPAGQQRIEKSYDIGHCFAGSACDNEGNLYFAHEYNLAIIGQTGLSFAWDQTAFSVVHDPVRDQIAFGTFEGMGILKKEQAIQYLGPSEGLHENGYIQNLGIDKNDDYWAGSYTGISRIDPDDLSCIPYTLQNGRLPCNGVFCSYLDESGIFWLGGDLGLMIYHDDSDSIVLIPSELVKSRVKSVTGLDQRHLILSTKEGLFVFDKRSYLEGHEVKYHYYNASNGYPGIDPGFTGMYRDSRNQIWICSATSLVKLDPKKLLLTNQELLPKITHFNEERVGFAHDTQFYGIYGNNSVIIGYEATGFHRPFETKFQYKLDDNPWSSWTVENKVILKDLYPGKHVFKLRAGPTDLGTDRSNYDQLSFSIRLPFYQYPGFQYLGGGLFLALLGLAAFYFIRQRMAHQQYLRQLDEARYLRSQLLLAELNPHFIFNVLASIQHKVLFEKKELAADYVVKLSKLMRNYLNASHKANQLQTGKPEYEIPLAKEIELLRDFMDFEKMKNNDHFDFHLVIDPNLEPDYLMIPPMLIQPFVENAIKHGLLLNEKKGNLWVKFKANKTDLICLVEDDGVGREEAGKRKTALSSGHKSLGSKIVMERVEILNKLGYSISIRSRDRKPTGTIVSIELKEEL
jgi:ligand-binding sensor domain-containing protein/two-component sensor histidine kinase